MALPPPLKEREVSEPRGVPSRAQDNQMPVTSVCPHVRLEAVVVLVLLAADPAFIGPWKTAGKEPISYLVSTRPSTHSCHWVGMEPWQTLRTNRDGTELEFMEPVLYSHLQPPLCLSFQICKMKVAAVTES